MLYGELYENIDFASKALTSLGIKKNDRIMYLMPNIPETAYLMYGTTQIGAVADYVDPRPDSVDLKISAKKILDLFIEEKANYIIALDQCYLAMIKPIEKELKELGIENIVVVSASDSMYLKATANYMLETANFEGLKGLKNKLANMKKMDELIKEVKVKLKYVIFENVASITSKRFKPTLDLFKEDLVNLGYSLYDDILCATDFEIPQTRKRYFLVAILDKNKEFKFPVGKATSKKVKDFLDLKVDDKYYYTSSKYIKNGNKLIFTNLKNSNIKYELDIDKLFGYRFHGNIRELENILERAAIFTDGNIIGANDLDLRPDELEPVDSKTTALCDDHSAQSLREVEKQAIERALRRWEGNRTKAAEELGITRRTLINKIAEFDLDL